MVSDDDADGAVQRGLKIADPAQRFIVIDAEFVGQLFSVERPALAVGGDPQTAVEQRQIGAEQHRTLKHMPRNAFVINQRRDRKARPDAGIAQVDIKSAGPRAIQATALGIAARRADLDRRGDAADFERRRRDIVEHARHQRADRIVARVGKGKQRGAAIIGVGPELIQPFAQRRQPCAGAARG